MLKEPQDQTKVPGKSGPSRKSRDSAKMLRKSAPLRKKYRSTSLMLIGLSVAVVIGLIAVGVFVVLPRIRSFAAANPNMNCTLIVPANPLTAQGLATPYQLVATDAALGPCNEANANQSAFVQGVIYSPNTGQINVYNPLVIDQGTQPLVVPTAPQLPRGAIVALWFGFNGTNLTLQGAQANTLQQARCVNGLNGSVFMQFAYCNAPAFFLAANQGIARGRIQVPPIGTAKDGQPCLTTRAFGLIDQDQSDNVQTQYLANANGQIAQFTAANKAQLANTNPVLITNPSDNALLTNFVDPALGCTPWTHPNLADNNAPVAALATDELQAARFQGPPVALVPLTDPMTMVGTTQSATKTNLYRIGSDQAPINNVNNGNGTTYCQNFLNIGIPRIKLDMTLFMNATSPAPAAATNLFTFLAMRANMSYTNLNCQNLLNIPNPVTLTTDGNGVVTAATINTTTTTTTTTNTATGTVNAILNTNAHSAQISTNLTIANFANKQFFVNITDSATGTQLLHQAENTGGNGTNAATTTINNLNITTIPNTWVATVTDANGNTLGTANFVSNGATAVATLTATSTGTTTTTGTGTTTTTTPTTTATTTNTATGTVNAILNANAHSAQVSTNINIANFANQQFFVNITDSATGTQLLHQQENTDGNGANAATTTINNLNITTIPNTWVATITDANGNTLGSANFVSNGATAVATLTATSTGTTTTGTGTTTTGQGTGTTTTGRGRGRGGQRGGR